MVVSPPCEATARSSMISMNKHFIVPLHVPSTGLRAFLLKTSTWSRKWEGRKGGKKSEGGGENQFYFFFFFFFLIRQTLELKYGNKCTPVIFHVFSAVKKIGEIFHSVWLPDHSESKVFMYSATWMLLPPALFLKPSLEQ